MNPIILTIMITSVVILIPPASQVPAEPTIIVVEDRPFDADSSEEWKDYCDVCNGYIGNSEHYVYKEEYLVCMNCYGRQHELD